MRFTRLLWLLGLVLSIGAGLVFLYFANAYAPPPARVLVAGRDLAPGEVLREEVLLYDEVRIAPEVLEGLIRYDEMEDWLGAVVVEPIHTNEYVHKGRLVKGENPLALSRPSLQLDDPGMMIKTIPVSPERCPDIRVGDYVDVEVVLNPGMVMGLQELEGGVQMPQLLWEAPYPVARDPLPPLAKAVLRGVKVVGVVRERIPVYGEEGELAFQEGEVRAIDVLMPRAWESPVTWAVANGEVHVSLLSPLVGHGGSLEPEPSPGFSLSDFYAFFLRDREKAMGVEVGAVGVVTATPTLTVTVPLTPTPAGTVLPLTATPTPAVTVPLTPTPAVTVPPLTPTPAGEREGVTPKGALMQICGGVILLLMLAALGALALRRVRARRGGWPGA